MNLTNMETKLKFSLKIKFNIKLVNFSFHGIIGSDTYICTQTKMKYIIRDN